MAAIRTEELSCCAPAKLHVITGGTEPGTRRHAWHPSMGPQARSSMSAGGATSQRPRKNPNFPLRRLVVALAAIALLTGASMGISTLAFSDSPVSSGTEYIVQPGDTLWSIAKVHAPGSDPRRTVEAIRTINNISSDIHPGQQIFLPA